MRHALQKGLSFGLTSGVITTLGLLVGLNSGTHSSLVVIGGILVIAIADAFSDALGMHLSEESENKHATLEIWEATVYTFLAKFIFASTFVIPILLLRLPVAVVVSVVYGLLLLGIFSFYIAREQKNKPWRVILEHVLIASAVIILTNYVGAKIHLIFQ